MADAPPTSPVKKRSLRRRVATGLVVGLGGLLGAVLLLTGGLLLWLRTDGGQGFLSRKILGLTQGAIAGRLEIDHLRLSGLLRIEADAARLYPPNETVPTLSTGRIFIGLRLRDLLRRNIEVELLDIDRPVVHIVHVGDTTNIALAFAAPPGSPPPPPPAPTIFPHIGLHAPQVHLKGGIVNLDGAWPFGAEGVDIDGAVDGSLDDMGITATVRGRSVQPTEREVHIEVQGRCGATGFRIARMSTKIGGSEVLASGLLDFDLSRAELQLQKASLASKDLNAFVPQAALLADVSVSGNTTLEKMKLQSHLELHVPTAGILIDQSAQFSPHDFGVLVDYETTVRTSAVDLHEIREDLPRARVTALLHVKGQGTPLTGTADVDVDASGSQYEKLAVERLQLKSHVDGRVARIDQLDVESADLHVKAAGTVGLSEGDLTVAVDAPRLRNTGRLLARGFGIDLPPLDGRAHISAQLGGPWVNPHGTLEVGADGLLVGTTRVASLQSSLRLQRLDPDPSGSFSVTAHGAALKGRTPGDLMVSGSVDETGAHLDGGGRFGGAPARLVLRATHATERTWTFGTFRTTILSKSVASETPFTVRYHEGRIRIQRLKLTGDLGTFALDADAASKGPIQAHLRVSDFRAERLPAVLLPDGLNLAGTVNLSADARGTAESPIADLKLSVHDARFRALSDMSLDTKIHVEGQRAGGRLLAHVGASSVRLDFQLPLLAPAVAFARRTPAYPLDLTLDVDDLSLKELGTMLPAPLPVTASVDGHLELHGTTRNPTLQTKWSAVDLSSGPIDKVQADVDVAYNGGQWKAQLHAARPGAADLATRAEVRMTVAELVSGHALSAADLSGKAALDIGQLDLKWLAQLGYGPADLAGAVTGHIALDGSRSSPHISGSINAAGLAAAGYRDVGAQLTVTTTDHVAVAANVTLAGAPAVSLTAAWLAPPIRLAGMTLAEQLGVPFSLHVELAPTPVARLLPPVVPGTDVDPPLFQASLGAAIDAEGTVNDPHVHAQVTVGELTRQNVPVGTLTAELEYRKSHLLLTSLFESKTAGTLHARIELSPDLGGSALLDAGRKILSGYTGPEEERPSALGAGLKATLAEPAEVTVDATHFNLALADGFAGPFYDLGGTIDLHLKKSGPLAVLNPAGSLEFGRTLEGLMSTLAVDHGKVTFLGYGSFSELELKASGHGTSLEVTELRGQSGKGSFHGTASLLATAPTAYKGNLSLNLDGFPIVQDFQTRGFISLQILASGTGSPGHIDIPLIELRQGHAMIPKKLPRNVQSLQPNPDVELADPARKTGPKLVSGSSWAVHIGKILIPDDFVVDAPLGTQLKLGANLALVAGGQDGPPVDLTGELHVVEGHITLLRRFDVDEGRLTFRSRELEDPAVRVRAHYDGPDATVKVTLSGTLDDLQKTFVSSPPMSEDEIFSYLATGERQSHAQDADPSAYQAQLTDAAITAVGAAAIGVVQGAVMQFLPDAVNPDVLTVSTNVAQGTIGPIRAGKYYLNGKLYVGGQYNPSANPLLYQNQYEGQASYRLGSYDTLHLIVGSDGNHSLYFLLEKSLPAQRQKLSPP